MKENLNKTVDLDSSFELNEESYEIVSTPGKEKGSLKETKVDKPKNRDEIQAKGGELPETFSKELDESDCTIVERSQEEENVKKGEESLEPKGIKDFEMLAIGETEKKEREASKKLDEEHVQEVTAIIDVPEMELEVKEVVSEAETGDEEVMEVVDLSEGEMGSKVEAPSTKKADVPAAVEILEVMEESGEDAKAADSTMDDSSARSSGAEDSDIEMLDETVDSTVSLDETVNSSVAVIDLEDDDSEPEILLDQSVSGSTGGRSLRSGTGGRSSGQVGSCSPLAEVFPPAPVPAAPPASPPRLPSPWRSARPAASAWRTCATTAPGKAPGRSRSSPTPPSTSAWTPTTTRRCSTSSPTSRCTTRSRTRSSTWCPSSPSRC